MSKHRTSRVSKMLQVAGRRNGRTGALLAAAVFTWAAAWQCLLSTPGLSCECVEPDITCSALSGQCVCSGDSVTFSATASDFDLVPNTQWPICATDEDTVTYAWSGGGTPATGTGSSFTTHWDTPGTKTVTLTVNDGGSPHNDEAVVRQCTVQVGRDPSPPIAGGSVNPQYDCVGVNETVEDVYDNYCTDQQTPTWPHWTVDGYDNDTFCGTLVGDPVCYDLSYEDAEWVGDYSIRWTQPGVYTVSASVSDRGQCGGDDMGTAQAEVGRVTLVGGTIDAPDGTLLYVWCPDSANASKRKTFWRLANQQAGTTYLWEIAEGSDKVHIVGTNTGQSVVVEPHAPSTSWGDVILRLTYDLNGCQGVSNLPLTVLRPYPGTSHYSETDLCNAIVLGYKTVGKLIVYTVKDQFGNIMAGNKALWTETSKVVEGSEDMIGPQSSGVPMDENGQSNDVHGMQLTPPTPPQISWTCDMPVEQDRQYGQLDQRITINGWGASECADAETQLPAFWRFRVDKWLGTDGSGNPAGKVTVQPW